MTELAICLSVSASIFINKTKSVPRRGLEPPRLSAQPPQGCAATVTPPGQVFVNSYTNSYRRSPIIPSIFSIFNRLRERQTTFLCGYILRNSLSESAFAYLSWNTDEFL